MQAGTLRAASTACFTGFMMDAPEVRKNGISRGPQPIGRRPRATGARPGLNGAP
jgi:hypothetical protein